MSRRKFWVIDGVTIDQDDYYAGTDAERAAVDIAEFCYKKDIPVKVALEAFGILTDSMVRAMNRRAANGIVTDHGR